MQESYKNFFSCMTFHHIYSIHVAFHQGAVQSTSISPDGQLLGSAGDDGQAIVYRIRSGEGEFISGPENRQIKGHTDAVNDISFSPDSCNFVTCSSDGTIQLWDCETGKNRVKMQTKYGKLISTKFTPNGKRVATLSSNYLSVWDLTTGKVEWEVEDEDGRNYQVFYCSLSFLFLSPLLLPYVFV